eukprot:COSAG02_NODE_31198_length_537_cov_2.789954_1_plen_70_part_00
MEHPEKRWAGNAALGQFPGVPGVRSYPPIQVDPHVQALEQVMDLSHDVLRHMEIPQRDRIFLIESYTRL